MRVLYYVCALAVGVVACSGTVLAQGRDDDPAPEYGVMEQPRPEFDAKGIPLGGFRLFPDLKADFAHDDNVFRQASALADTYFVQAPEVRIKSEWGRHFAELFGGAQIYTYDKYDTLNLTDWTVGGDGRYDISRAATFSLLGSYGQYHEALTSPNTVGFQASPNRYLKTHVEAVGAYQPNRLSVQLGGSFDSYDYESAELIGGGLLNNDDRDMDEKQVYAKFSYDFSPGYKAFVKTLYDSRSFDSFLDRSGTHRSSTGYRVNGGVDLQLTNLLQGEVFLGYLEQHYAQAVAAPLKNISGLDYGIQLDWFASPIVTVHLNGSREISDVVIAGVAASDNRIVRLSADYEILYNLIAQPYISFTESKLSGSTRTDDYPSAGLDMKYLMNRYLAVDLSYDYNQRATANPASRFTDNVVMLSLTGHI